MSSLSLGTYINYKTIKNPEYINKFLHDHEHKVFSNVANMEKSVATLLEHERARKGDNIIYCIKLRIMIPKKFTDNQKHEFIKQFMLNIHYDYKLIPWIYKFINVSDGHYIDILIFERVVFKHPNEQVRLYKRDMYIDPETGHTVSADYPNARQICKAGEVQRDKDGNVKKDLITVSPKKYRHLNYKTSKNEDKKKKRFVAFKKKLEAHFFTALSKAVTNYMNFYRYKKIKYAQRKYGIGSQRFVQINDYNDLITRLNMTFMNMQDQVLYAYQNDPAAMKSVYSLMAWCSKILENGKVTVNEKYSYNLDPTNISKNDSYKDNLYYFANYVGEKVKTWWLEDSDVFNIFKLLQEDEIFDYTQASPQWWLAC